MSAASASAMAALSTRLVLSRSLYHSNPNTVFSTRFCTATSPSPPKATDGGTLKDGVDVGIYKAILVGQVGQSPMQKRMKNGAVVTMFTLGTGGIRNNRRPLETEKPSEYANRCMVQWHRVCIYSELLGKIAVQHAQPGSIIYVEGNLDTKIFTEPITGVVRRLREIGVRKDGRLVFLGEGSGAGAAAGIKGVGYY